MSFDLAFWSEDPPPSPEHAADVDDVRVPSEKLRDLLVEQGHDLRRLDPPWDGFEVVGRGARFYVTPVDDGALQAGDVWAVAVTGPSPSRRVDPRRRASGSDGVTTRRPRRRPEREDTGAEP